TTGTKNPTRGADPGAPAPVPTTRNPAVPGLRNTGTQNPHLTAPEHVKGTVHETKEDADNDPNEQH
ncbi:hypothetical protein ACL1BR_00005, partial [Corynebacterium striatum]